MLMDKKEVLEFLDRYLDKNKKGICAYSEEELMDFHDKTSNGVERFALKLIINQVKDCKPVKSSAPEETSTGYRISEPERYRGVPFHYDGDDRTSWEKMTIENAIIGECRTVENHTGWGRFNQGDQFANFLNICNERSGTNDEE